MNNNYTIIYQVDKYENQVSTLPMDELGEATKGINVIKKDKHITIWDCEEYQVIALKAWPIQLKPLHSYLLWTN